MSTVNRCPHIHSLYIRESEASRNQESKESCPKLPARIRTQMDTLQLCWFFTTAFCCLSYLALSNFWTCWNSAGTTLGLWLKLLLVKLCLGEYHDRYKPPIKVTFDMCRKTYLYFVLIGSGALWSIFTVHFIDKNLSQKAVMWSELQGVAEQTVSFPCPLYHSKADSPWGSVVSDACLGAAVQICLIPFYWGLEKPYKEIRVVCKIPGEGSGIFASESSLTCL